MYYLFYRSTIQEKALQLMGSKMEASLAIEGKFSEEGLLAMTQGEDMTTAMAKALVDGLDVEGAEDIWRKINRKNAELTGKAAADDVPGDAAADIPVDIAADTSDDNKPELDEKPEPGEDGKVVYVNFVTFVGKKRKRKKIEKKAVTKKELDKMVAEKDDEAQVQLSLFG